MEIFRAILAALAVAPAHASQLGVLFIGTEVPLQPVLRMLESSPNPDKTADRPSKQENGIWFR